MNEGRIRHFATILGISLGRVTSNMWLMSPCPFAPYLHKKGTDRRPGFGITVNDSGSSHYNCFACKSKGSLPGLAYSLGRYRGDDNKDLGIEIEREELFGAKDDFNSWETEESARLTNKEPLDRDVGFLDYPTVFGIRKPTKYLESRNISYRTSMQLGLRYDTERERILFPIYDNSKRLRGFSGRAVNKGASRKVEDYLGLDKRLYWLGEHKFISGKPIIVVEGLFDYAKLVQYGIPNVYCMLGTALTEPKLQTLASLDSMVIWMLDNDLAGEQAIYGTDTYAGILNTVRDIILSNMVVRWPKNVEDPCLLSEFQAKHMILSAEFTA